MSDGERTVTDHQRKGLTRVLSGKSYLAELPVKYRNRPISAQTELANLEYLEQTCRDVIAGTQTLERLALVLEALDAERRGETAFNREKAA